MVCHLLQLGLAGYNKFYPSKKLTRFFNLQFIVFDRKKVNKCVSAQMVSLYLLKIYGIKVQYTSLVLAAMMINFFLRSQPLQSSCQQQQCQQFRVNYNYFFYCNANPAKPYKNCLLPVGKKLFYKFCFLIILNCCYTQ